MITYALATVFAGWLALSIASQFSDRVSRAFPRLETLGLIPHWTFFAPRPSMHDVHLLYRDRFESGRIGPVCCVPTIEPRQWYHAIWHPRKFKNKVVADVMLSLGLQIIEMEGQNADPRWLLLTDPYLMALHLAMSMPQPAGATARQFILARSNAFVENPDRHIVFFSEFHGFES